MSLPDNLVQKIEDTRILYPKTPNGGITITGSPFSIDFDEPVNPPEFCDTISTAEDPWRMFGLKLQIGDDYWKLVGNLFHVEDELLVGSSKITLEVAPEWCRVYVKKDCSAERVAEFLHTLEQEYSISVTFADEGNER